MILSEIQNNRFLRYLRNKIEQNADDRQLMKTTLYCGSRVIKQPGKEPAVYVLANNKDAKFWGHTSCKNAWICPSCSAKLMAKYADEIACAIEAIKLKKNQVACMITFTIPHTRGMSCEETTQILFNTWKAFNVRGNKNLKTSWYAKEKSYSREGNKVRKFGKGRSADVFASFSEEFNCKHRIRVGEYTWGIHGWHPHFHCLFFVDKNKLQQVADWQEALNNRWYTLAKRQTIKLWNKMYPEKTTDNQTRADIMYSKMDTKGSNGCFISVDNEGKVIEQKSSMYICGWGADRELTGNFKNKATADEHFSPYEILEEYDKTKDEKWMDLYMEFARAIKKTKHTRISFGNSGIRCLVQQWKLTNTYKQVLKKKASDLVQNDVGLWRVVCWFTRSQWNTICSIDKYMPLKEMILECAREPDGYTIIKDTLAQFEIILHDREPLGTSFEKVEKMFNPVTAKENMLEEIVA